MPILNDYDLGCSNFSKTNFSSTQPTFSPLLNCNHGNLQSNIIRVDINSRLNENEEAGEWCVFLKTRIRQTKI